MSGSHIVAIVLDCGHTRTWSVLAHKQHYGNDAIAECKHCHTVEKISSIMQKAEAVSDDGWGKNDGMDN